MSALFSDGPTWPGDAAQLGSDADKDLVRATDACKRGAKILRAIACDLQAAAHYSIASDVLVVAADLEAAIDQ